MLHAAAEVQGTFGIPIAIVGRDVAVNDLAEQCQKQQRTCHEQDKASKALSRTERKEEAKPLTTGK